MASTTMNWYLLLLLAFGTASCLADDALSPAEQENLQKLAIANNDLAFNLFQILSSGTSKNIFISPLSISTAFGMLFYGTRGDTATELRKALGYAEAGLSTENVPEAFHTILTKVLKGDGSGGSYVLKSANGILVDKDLPLVPGYKEEVQEEFQASVREVDFGSNTQQIVNEINQWVKEKTNGLIDKLLDQLSAHTVLFLLNAIYFKGTWKVEFDKKDTYPQIFYNNGFESGAKEVPFMHMTTRLRYAQMSGFQALELLYKGENTSMLVLLPDERDGLPALQQTLSQDKVGQILDNLWKTKVEVSLPKFKVQYSEELSSEIASLGAQKIFRRGAADFSGITTSDNLFVNLVLHKTVVEVNEEGSEAAAVTGIGLLQITSVSIPRSIPEFRADHPFLYFILERGSGRNLILFMGDVKEL